MYFLCVSTKRCSEVQSQVSRLGVEDGRDEARIHSRFTNEPSSAICFRVRTDNVLAWQGTGTSCSCKGSTVAGSVTTNLCPFPFEAARYGERRLKTIMHAFIANPRPLVSPACYAINGAIGKSSAWLLLVSMCAILRSVSHTYRSGVPVINVHLEIQIASAADLSREQCPGVIIACASCIMHPRTSTSPLHSGSVV